MNASTTAAAIGATARRELEARLAEFEAYGERHHAEGIPRNANPFLHAAYSNGARKAHTRPSVLAWWRGWDRARKRQDEVEAFALAAAAIAQSQRRQERAQ